MSAGIETDPNDLNQLLDHLDAAAAQASDLTGVWPEVGQVWAQRQRSVFAARKGWPPLAPATLRRKRGVGGGEPLVRRGLLLAESVSPIPVRQSKGYVVLGIGAPEVVRYAHWHQRGAGVPQRQPVPRLTPSERKALVEPIGDAIGDALRGR